jgi:hypothetical protein
MKGLLRGLMTVGLIGSGVLGASCDKGPGIDTSKTPTHERYQPSRADEASPPRDERMEHPADDAEGEWRQRSGHQQTSRRLDEPPPPMGGGTTAPSEMRVPEAQGIGGSGEQPGRADLGLGLADSYKAAPAQGGSQK